MNLLLGLLLLCQLLLSGVSAQDWSYNDDSGVGPSNWYKNYPLCGGDLQSPVDIGVATDNNDLTPLAFQGYDEILKNPYLINNGLKARVYSESKPTLSGGCLGTDVYEYAEFHFHWGSDDSLGSEHAVNGHFYPMEGHILHINKKYGNLDEAVKHPDGIAILGTFYESTGVADDALDPMIKAVKEASQKAINATIKLDPSLTLQQLLPKNVNDFYCYRQGSLETPACPQSVNWTIFKDTYPLSSEQIAAFRTLRFFDGTPMVNNFRPLQPLNGRTIYFHGNR